MTSRSYTLISGCELLLEVSRYRAHVPGGLTFADARGAGTARRNYIWTDLARVKSKRVSGA